MGVNQNPGPPPNSVRLDAHWRTLSWAGLDKSLQLVYGIVFLLLVLRALPREEYGLLGLAIAIQLTLSQFSRSLWLLPLTKFVAERRQPGRIASTGMSLHVGTCAGAALLLWAGRDFWAGLFEKPLLVTVLVPTAALLVLSSPRDAAVANLEGQRRLRAVFFLDAAYYALAVAGLVLWRHSAWPREAAPVQWIQAAAAGLAMLLAMAVTGREMLRPVARFEAGRILRFGLGSLATGLGSTLQQQGDTLLAGRLMDASGIATYNAAKMIFRVFNALAQAVNQVMMPLVSRLENAERRTDLRILFEKSVCFLSLGIGPLCILLILGTGPLLGLLFAGRYTESVRPLQILVASALTLPLATVGSAYLVGLGELRSLTWMTWMGVFIGLGLAAVWIPVYGPSGAALATLIAAVFGMVVRTWVLRRQLGFRLVDIAARSRDAWQFARARLLRPAPKRP
jgi:O-antigen/teichoic acid export membrane protein